MKQLIMELEGGYGMVLRRVAWFRCVDGGLFLCVDNGSGVVEVLAKALLMIGISLDNGDTSTPSGAISLLGGAVIALH